MDGDAALGPAQAMTVDALRALYGTPSEIVQRKSLDRLDQHCRAFIALSPFLVIGTAAADRTADCSPRGDAPGFVAVLDDKTLLLPDRPGERVQVLARVSVARAQCGARRGCVAEARGEALGLRLLKIVLPQADPRPRLAQAALDAQQEIGGVRRACRLVQHDLLAVEVEPLADGDTELLGTCLGIEEPRGECERELVGVTDAAPFEEAVWQLARPLRRADIRVLSLEPGGPQTLTAAPRLDPASRSALSDAIDPARLEASLSTIRGQTAIVTGRVGQLCAMADEDTSVAAAITMCRLRQRAIIFRSSRFKPAREQ